MAQPFIYLDNNATTRIAPEVLETMLPFLSEHWGNPSSVYSFGHDVAKHLDTAREHVATLLGASPREIVFTSGGTESNNSAISSTLQAAPKKRHIIMSSVEHSSNIKLGASLQKRGYEVTLLPVEPDGSLDVHLVEKSIRPETALVSVMWANNETGILFPVQEIAAICRSKAVPFHTDAIQAAGKIGIDVDSFPVDFLSLSAHKLHGPKGVGALYVRRRTSYHPFVIGGGQERGRRGGTENVASVVGFGKASELAIANLEEENTRVRRLRDRLEAGILESITGTSRNGTAEPRLPNTTNIAFDGVDAEGILLLLDQANICASSGSACSSGSLDPSHVLLAMGATVSRARGSVRFSLGMDNTDADVNYTLQHLPNIVRRLRATAPMATATL